ncbi:MAG: class I SAM-dependent methyltransferase [Gammaproteobacteria bacterium]|nr:class I SAM-dependent methyltransferase [Gammaproteobacteria bacterium]
MWDKRYDTKDYVYGKDPNDFLASVADGIPAGKTLCIAEGEGRNAVFLAEHGHDVVAVDASAVGLAKARELADERGVQIQTVIADLAHLDIAPDSWDAVVSIFAHVPSETRESLHRKIVRGLRSGGMLVLEAYTPEQISLGTGGPPVVELTMTLEALQRELDGLVFRHAVELQRDVIEGRLHTGTGAVVQLLAVKP